MDTIPPPTSEVPLGDDQGPEYVNLRETNGHQQSSDDPGAVFNPSTNMGTIPPATSEVSLGDDQGPKYVNIRDNNEHQPSSNNPGTQSVDRTGAIAADETHYTGSTSPTVQSRVVEVLKQGKLFLRLPQLVLSFCVLICSIVWETSIPNTGASWVVTISILSGGSSVGLYVIYRNDELVENMHRRCLRLDFIVFAILGFLDISYISCAILATVYAQRHSSIAASSVFCYLCIILYTVEIIFLVREDRTFRKAVKARSMDNIDNID